MPPPAKAAAPPAPKLAAPVSRPVNEALAARRAEQERVMAERKAAQEVQAAAAARAPPERDSRRRQQERNHKINTFGNDKRKYVCMGPDLPWPRLADLKISCL